MTPPDAGRWKWIILVLVLAVSAPGCMGASRKEKAIGPDRVPPKTPKIWDTSKLTPNHIALARELMDKGFYDVALVQLRAAIQKDGSRVAAHNLAGVCARETGEYAAGLAYFKTALDLDRDNASVHNNLAILYALMKKGESAHRHFNRAVALDPARADFFNNLGYFLMGEKDYPGAETRLKQALALAPADENVVNNLAICLGRLKKDEEALKLLMAHHPMDLAFYNMGCIYRLRNETARAEAMFDLSRSQTSKTEAKNQGIFDRQVMNPAAPADPSPADGMTGDVAHTIYTKKYLPSMKSDANGLEEKKE